MKNRFGMTLLEVLIAVVILAVLSGLTAQTIQRSLRVKSKIQGDIDRESSLRNAFRLIERDINSAFHFRDLNYELKQELAKAQQGAGAPGAPPGAPPVTPPVPGVGTEPAPKQLTQFLGESDSLHFTSLNHIRMMRDSKESDQEEVGYYLETCKGRNEDNQPSQCLFRRTSAIIDDKVDEGGASIMLLENVSTFKLRYLGKGQEEWVDTWRTDGKGIEESTRDKFPQAVELTLITNQKNREFGLSSVVPLHFPNNKPEKKNANPQAAAK